ncbi:hypothetical protein JCM5353_000764 [Sporobolomyces roseus]
MPPYLPNEIISAIFEDVYDSLCLNPVLHEPDYPVGVYFVFSNFSLVSKLYHSVALPFLVRYLNGKNVVAFTEFIEKYHLGSAVRSFDLVPEFEGYRDPDKIELDEVDADTHELEELTAIRFARAKELHDEAIQREFKRWKRAIEICCVNLESLRISFAPKICTGEEYWYGGKHDTASWPTRFAPIFDLLPFVKALSDKSRLGRIRLDVPFRFRTQSHSIESDDVISTIACSFPNINTLNLLFRSRFPIEPLSHPITFPALTTLRILKIAADSLGIGANIRPTYLVPSANSLRHLEIDLVCAVRVHCSELFGSLTFPSMTSLVLAGGFTGCTHPDFFDRFPHLAVASIPFNNDTTGSYTLPRIPDQLQALYLTDVGKSAIFVLADLLEAANLSCLLRLGLEGKLGSQSDWLNRRGSTVATLAVTQIIEICKAQGVQLCYDNAIQGPAGAPRNEPFELEELPSEDESFDWDAEDGEEYRVFWSEAKKLELEIG